MNETQIKTIVSEITSNEEQVSHLRRALGMLPVPGTELTESQLATARTKKTWFLLLSVTVSLLILTAGNLLLSPLATQAGYFVMVFSIGQLILHFRDIYGSAEYHTETELLRGNMAIAIRNLGDVVLLVAAFAVAALSVSITFSGGSQDIYGGDGIDGVDTGQDTTAHTLGTLTPWHQRDIREPRQTHRLLEQSSHRDDRRSLVRNAPLMVQPHRQGARTEGVVRQSKNLQRADWIGENRKRLAGHITHQNRRLSRKGSSRWASRG